MNNWELLTASGIFGLALVLLSTLGMGAMTNVPAQAPLSLPLSDARVDQPAEYQAQQSDALEMIDLTPRKICDLTWNRHCQPPGGVLLVQSQ